MGISIVQTLLPFNPAALQAPLTRGLSQTVRDAAASFAPTVSESAAHLTGMLPVPDAIPALASHFWRNLPDLITTLPFSLPTEIPMPFLQAGLHFEFLENSGLPPEIIAPLTVFLAIPGKIEIAPLLLFAGLAAYYRSVNRPGQELNLHIEETNRELPILLEKQGPLPIQEISSPADAAEITDRLRKLYPYSVPHYTESNGLAYRGFKPLLSRSRWTLPLHNFLEWPRRKIRAFLERKDAEMGENERLENMLDPKEIRKKILSLIHRITSYQRWPRRLFNFFRVAMKGEKWSPKHPLYIPDNAAEPTENLLKALKRELHDMKQKAMRDAIIVMKGKEPVADYAAPELTPEAIGEMTSRWGDLIAARLAQIKFDLDDPAWLESLTPAERASLNEELDRYAEASAFEDTPAVQRFLGPYIDVEWRLNRWNQG